MLRARADEPLLVSFDGDNIHVAAPSLHFLTGKPLDRLKDAATVVYLSKLTLSGDNFATAFRPPVPERLIVSYDLWEEKFSVTIRGASTRTTPRLLNASQAEAWCFENLAVSALGLASNRPFWLRLELRTADQREIPRLVGDSGISFTGLIELFGRKAGADDFHEERSAGPFRLIDLPRTVLGRGTRLF
ncbi:MAG: hypothetical protein LAQ69_33740 [Acidobacteriia bacterium]|nr:hypothetical protein [Terriglobia bacterium]